MNRPNLIRGWTLYERLVIALIVLEVTHIMVLFEDPVFPLPLLYGPLFWSLYAFLLGKPSLKIIKQLFVYSLPFILFAIWNLLLGDEVSWSYYQWYLPIMVAVQVIFPFFVLLKMKNMRPISERVMLLRQQMALGIGISTFVATLFLKHYMNVDFEINVDPIYGIVVALCFSIGLLFNYLYTFQYHYNRNVQPKDLTNGIIKSEIEGSYLASCASLLNKAMEIDKLYLDAQLSLDRLSEYTSLPKSTISNYLRNVLGYSYYEWLASYRIKHAIQLLENGNAHYKLEAIAQASGFSSKTTFNRYFKDIVGVLPSLYRDQISLD